MVFYATYQLKYLIEARSSVKDLNSNEMEDINTLSSRSILFRTMCDEQNPESKCSKI
jgi:hypothetical protein